MIKLTCLAASTFFLALFSTGHAQRREITIRLLDSKTGKSIIPSELQIVHSSQAGVPPLWLKPDKTGVFSFSPPEALKDMRIYAAFGKAQWSLVACDIHGGKAPPFYLVSNILEHGVVADNECNRKKASPSPGELVIFVRKMTFWKRWLRKICRLKPFLINGLQRPKIIFFKNNQELACQPPALASHSITPTKQTTSTPENNGVHPPPSSLS